MILNLKYYFVWTILGDNILEDFLKDLKNLVIKYTGVKNLEYPLTIMSVLGSALAVYDDNDKEEVADLYFLSLKILGKQVMRYSDDLQKISEELKENWLWKIPQKKIL